jgi:hypothetical protein
LLPFGTRFTKDGPKTPSIATMTPFCAQEEQIWQNKLGQATVQQKD